jgi:hypothetical protein
MVPWILGLRGARRCAAAPVWGPPPVSLLRGPGVHSRHRNAALHVSHHSSRGPRWRPWWASGPGAWARVRRRSRSPAADGAGSADAAKLPGFDVAAPPAETGDVPYRAVPRRGGRRAGARPGGRAGHVDRVLGLRVSVLRARAQDGRAAREGVRGQAAGRVQGVPARLPQPRDGRGAGRQVGAGAGQVLGVPRQAVPAEGARHAAARGLRARGRARHDEGGRGPRGAALRVVGPARPAAGSSSSGSRGRRRILSMGGISAGPSRSRCCAR